MTLTTTVDATAATPTVAIDGGWAGEVYTLIADAPLYAGATRLTFNSNNLALDVRYLWVIGWD